MFFELLPVERRDPSSLLRSVKFGETSRSSLVLVVGRLVVFGFDGFKEQSDQFRHGQVGVRATAVIGLIVEELPEGGLGGGVGGGGIVEQAGSSPACIGVPAITPAEGLRKTRHRQHLLQREKPLPRCMGRGRGCVGLAFANPPSVSFPATISSSVYARFDLGFLTGKLTRRPFAVGNRKRLVGNCFPTSPSVVGARGFEPPTS